MIMQLEQKLTELRAASAEKVSVTVTNLSEANGIFLTPVFTALQDGSFDLFNVGEAASIGLERIAEDGTIDPLMAEFAAATNGTGVAGVAGGGPVVPGQIVSAELAITNTADQRFFSYASMIIPSNDAFIGNGNPLMFPVFSGAGLYKGPVSFTVTGARVWDAGTEVNTETEAAFLNQTGPDQGEVEGGVVQLHPGFNGSEGNPAGSPVNILSGAATNGFGLPIDPVAADFTRDGGSNPVASFNVALVELGLRGKQTLTATDAGDVLHGGSGKDTLIGGAGDDHLFGESGSDRLYGNDGDDVLVGGFGNDTLDGGADNDLLSGGFGNDVLYGGDGNDILSGGAGNDRLTGGDGADLFVFEGGRDVITDFNAAEGDLLLLADGSSVEDALANVRLGQNGVVIDLGDNGRILLNGLTIEDVTADMFYV